MLTRVLVIVTAVLLLQPPGYCLCRLAAAPTRRATPELTPPARKACPCCRRNEAPREAPSRVEAPAFHLEHHPGCPVGPNAALALDPAGDGPALLVDALTPAAHPPTTAGLPAAGRPGDHPPGPSARRAPLRC